MQKFLFTAAVLLLLPTAYAQPATPVYETATNILYRIIVFYGVKRVRYRSTRAYKILGWRKYS